jgi:hypothetical protein
LTSICSVNHKFTKHGKQNLAIGVDTEHPPTFAGYSKGELRLPIDFAERADDIALARVAELDERR